MKRQLYFVYGVACHLLFLGTFACLAAFVGDLALPKTIDLGRESAVATALVIDALLMTAFAAQHSIMARAWFKRLWTQIVPTPIERSTYVLVSCLVTILLMWQWRSIDRPIWDVQNPPLRAAIWALFAFGWLLVPVVSLQINHFDLFGTRQVWLHLQQRPYEPLPFRTPLLYRYVRHPLYFGFIVAFWATPTMTVGHLLFAAVMTGYMLMAAALEERDLIAHFGGQYVNYRRHVPMFVPKLRPVTHVPHERAADAAANAASPD